MVGTLRFRVSYFLRMSIGDLRENGVPFVQISSFVSTVNSIKVYMLSTPRQKQNVKNRDLRMLK